MPEVLVPVERIERWVSNFAERHEGAQLSAAAGALIGTGGDGSRFTARLPFGDSYDGLADADAFAAAVRPPGSWGLLLVRKGGFAIALLHGREIVDSKVGQRHVQGRTKAGGQSQQRFARRRDNQARQAYEAAADHAARIFEGLGRLATPVVTGGDRPAVDEVLADPRLTGLRVVEPWLAVPDPRRRVLDQAVVDACSVAIHVENASS